MKAISVGITNEEKDGCKLATKTVDNVTNFSSFPLPSSLTYPTSSSVSFPYTSGPYAIQSSMMDAILKTLQDLDENTSYTFSSKINSSKDENKILKKARVIILESPTGTGKSLSFACAAVAWLRHRELVDFHKFLQSMNKKTFDNKMTKEQNSKDKKWIWLDKWQNPSISEHELQLKKRQKRSSLVARSARSALETELNDVRKIFKSVINIPNVDNMSVEKSDQEFELRRRKIRAKIAQDNIFHVKRRDYQFKHMFNYSNKFNSEVSFVKEGKEEEVLPQHYTSRRYSGGLLYSELLDGGQLDGSEISKKVVSSPFNNNKKNKSKSFSEKRHSIDSTTKSISSTTLTTIGNVEPGTGVRKIIYGARTHSQLSQFVGELRRLEKDETRKFAFCDHSTSMVHPIRVVALGGRKLLCGNENVAGKRNQRRDESLITEQCLDMQKGIANNDNSINRVGFIEDVLQQSLRKKIEYNDSKVITRHVNEKVMEGGVKRKLLSSYSIPRKINAKNRKFEEPKSEKCPLMISSEAISALAVHILAQPSDIEDLEALGSASQACAYYASRESLAAAEVVVMPYNLLFSRHARQALGLSLKQCLVIIDEAHNLPEALRSLSSCELRLPVIESASFQLTMYVQKYRCSLASENLFYLGQIRKCLIAMEKYLKAGITKSRKFSSTAACSFNNNDKTGIGTEQRHVILSVTEFLFTLKLDNLNIFKVLRYMKNSNLAHKVFGLFNIVKTRTDETKENGSIVSMGFLHNQFEEQKNSKDNSELHHSKHISSMSIVQSFLECLTCTQRDGKLIVEWPESMGANTTSNFTPSNVNIRYKSIVTPVFRFMLLNAATPFDDFLKEAYAVVLAGGTLRPFSHIAAELLSSDPMMVKEANDAERGCDICSNNQVIPFLAMSPLLTTFTCGHVVPPSHTYTICLYNGPTKMKLDFRHSYRMSPNVVDELGRCLLDLCHYVTAGMIIFFPSYSYLEHTVSRWRKTGIYDQIRCETSLFCEPGSACHVERILESFSIEATSRKSGAILLCVVGGKMSEGINFANDMARCVFVVGLPYPDSTDPVLMEKMKLMDRVLKETGNGVTGQEYYHNLCMRAINQSIGRAIRHANDYAAILLADIRYISEARVWRGLPQWIRGRQTHPLSRNFNESVLSIKTFLEKMSRLT